MSENVPDSSFLAQLRSVDRAIILALARRLKRWQESTQLPVHALVFATIACCHGLANIALCFLTEQPEWLWAVAFAGTGAIAFYVLDNESLLPAESGIALTEFGCEDKWMVWRLAYLAIATVGTVGLFFDPSLGRATLLVFLVETMALALMEYLLCFRLVDAATDAGLAALVEAFKEVFGAAGDGPEPGAPGGEPAPL